MGNIIQFAPRSKKVSTNTNRVEALVKGELDVYICDTCGEEFEVVFDNKPDKCPHCNRVICWENEK